MTKGYIGTVVHEHRDNERFIFTSVQAIINQFPGLSYNIVRKELNAEHQFVKGNLMIFVAPIIRSSKTK